MGTVKVGKEKRGGGGRIECKIRCPIQVLVDSQLVTVDSQLVTYFQE